MMFRIFTTALVCFAMTGCGAFKQMAFDKNTKTLDTKEKSIVLVALEVSRSDGSRYVPQPGTMFFETATAQSMADRSIFWLNTDADSVQENGTALYLARVALVGGEYKFQTVSGMASAFPLNPNFMVPLGIKLNVKPNSITYVGRVTAKMRRREAGEFRAGAMIPLLDQAAAGMQNHTWEITVDDKAERDLALFRANFPVLKDVTIETGPILKFDRAAAHRVWSGGAPPDKSAVPEGPTPAAAAPQ